MNPKWGIRYDLLITIAQRGRRYGTAWTVQVTAAWWPSRRDDTSSGVPAAPGHWCRCDTIPRLWHGTLAESSRRLKSQSSWKLGQKISVSVSCHWIRLSTVINGGPRFHLILCQWGISPLMNSLKPSWSSQLPYPALRSNYYRQHHGNHSPIQEQGSAWYPYAQYVFPQLPESLSNFSWVQLSARSSHCWKRNVRK